MTSHPKSGTPKNRHTLRVGLMCAASLIAAASLGFAVLRSGRTKPNPGGEQAPTAAEIKARNQRLLDDVDKAIAESKQGSAQPVWGGSRINKMLENCLGKSPEAQFQAFVDAGFVERSDLEARSVWVNQEAWDYLSRVEQLRTVVVKCIRDAVREKQGKPTVTVYSGKSGAALAVVHPDGTVAILR